VSRSLCLCERLLKHTLNLCAQLTHYVVVALTQAKDEKGVYPRAAQLAVGKRNLPSCQISNPDFVVAESVLSGLS
jgi:hypothetical protein